MSVPLMSARLRMSCCGRLAAVPNVAARPARICGGRISRRTLHLGVSSMPMQVASSAAWELPDATVGQPDGLTSVPMHTSYALTYYELMQLPRAASREAVRKAYQALVMPDAMHAHYSSDTLFSRAVILKAAAECLLDLELRRSYDERIKNKGPELRVSNEDLPGALALLQETGRHDLVIISATQWMNNNPTHPDIRDVACCLALAHWDRANQTLQTGTVAEACADLETAQSLIHKYDVSPHLLQQVEQVLQDHTSQRTLELLALPLGEEHAASRARGMSLLRSIIRNPSTYLDVPMAVSASLRPGQQSLLQAYLEKARAALTAQEQVDLAPELQASPVLSASSTAYDTALALMTLGFVNRTPHYIHKADRLLASLETGVAGKHFVEERLQQGQDPSQMQPVPQNVTRNSAVQLDEAPVSSSADKCMVAVERATCAMLLGQPGEALAVLGLAPAATGSGRRYAADPQIQEFVQEHSGGSRDLLPGAYLLTQRWIEEALLHGYREHGVAGAPSVKIDLQAWFSDLSVMLYLQVWTLARATPVLLEVAHLLSMLPKAAAAAATLAIVAGKKMQALKQLNGTGAAAASQQSHARSRLLQQHETAAAAAAAVEKTPSARSMVIGAAAWGQGGSASPAAAQAYERVASVEQRLQQELKQKRASAGSKRTAGGLEGPTGTAAAAASIPSGYVMRDAHRSHLAQASRAAMSNEINGYAGRMGSPGGEEPDEEFEEDDAFNAGAGVTSPVGVNDLRAQLHQMERAMWDSGDGSGSRTGLFAQPLQLLLKLAGLGAVLLALAVTARDRLMGMQSGSSAPAAAAITVQRRGK